ncbi:hypothetical protein [Pollutimonas bauzanensis]|uniref:Uncharacterized protein n=1 Tax=Pollutimonas bauzanensis TaxID=658167 RepID=A0A1M5UJF7_9BURK|nr:hypothetical protein [Pollutimonas bauzanensis]SHH63060.1 hypothetical protein SAMN04488135_10416 [Pollutimonas bauzanensis]
MAFAPRNRSAPNASSRNDYDSPWKDALEQYFEPALALLMPELHAIIDWSHPPQFLDKEFQAVSHKRRRRASGAGRARPAHANLLSADTGPPPY